MTDSSARAICSRWAEKGDRVESGDTVATIEAMKMEAGITTAIAGTVSRTAINSQ
ncbi:biotin/lipoyl-containing protein [Janibacter corallicola]|uniref:biotin/lipoyl-containing protein n=1 Tax=Janibacter corallicola TaxID=415212 RepID=UPI000B20821E|nr:biotin/lipoyl-containing protein [Janibacter corallicola]